MFLSRNNSEVNKFEYYHFNSFNSEEQEQESQRTEQERKQELQRNQQEQEEYFNNYEEGRREGEEEEENITPLHYIESSNMIAPITTKIRQSTALTEKIILEITKSIKIFKPSQSLYQLTNDNHTNHNSNCNNNEGEINKPTTSIDVVISGGGLKGYFVCGCVAVLQNQLQCHNIEIGRVAGASAGAWSALFICTGISTSLWIESYHKLLENPNRTIHEIYTEEMWPLVKEKLPPNAYLLCNNRMFISITVVTSFGLKNLIVSEYYSNEDLIEACLASSTIPYITERKMYRTFRGMKVVDGGLTNNTPVFRDGTRRQLIFRLSQIEYPWRLLINPVDSCIDALVIRGALQMAHFLSGEFVPSIAWLEKRQNENDLIRPGHRIRMIITPLVVISLILLRKTSISDLINIIEKSFQSNSLKEFTNIINFQEIDKEFSTNTIFYAVGTIYATIVDLARKMYLLL